VVQGEIRKTGSHQAKEVLGAGKSLIFILNNWSSVKGLDLS
jgi:hypothetical protein